MCCGRHLFLRMLQSYSFSRAFAQNTLAPYRPLHVHFLLNTTWKRREDTKIACTLPIDSFYYYYCYVNRGSIPNCQKCTMKSQYH